MALFLFWFNLFTFGCTGSLLLLRLFSSCGKQGLLSSCGAWPSHCGSFCCSSWTLEPQVQELWPMGLVTLQPVGSSWIKDRTHVSCIAGRFFITEPLEKPLHFSFFKLHHSGPPSRYLGARTFSSLCSRSTASLFKAVKPQIIHEPWVRGGEELAVGVEP